MRRAFLALSLAVAAAVPFSSTAHADACSHVSTWGTRVPHEYGWACIGWIGVYGCEWQSVGVVPDGGVAFEVCY